ncbi:MAG: hypothetical protein R3B68_05245 [Phycisphaerales bacterium]
MALMSLEAAWDALRGQASREAVAALIQQWLDLEYPINPPPEDPSSLPDLVMGPVPAAGEWVDSFFYDDLYSVAFGSLGASSGEAPDAEPVKARALLVAGMLINDSAHPIFPSAAFDSNAISIIEVALYSPTPITAAALRAILSRHPRADSTDSFAVLGSLVRTVEALLDVIETQAFGPSRPLNPQSIFDRVAVQRAERWMSLARDLSLRLRQ